MTQIVPGISPILRSQRLILRPLSDEDIEAIFFLRSDPGVNRYIKRELATTLADARAWLEKITQGNWEQKSFNWAITFPEEGTMMGSICLWNFSPDRTAAEIGYDLHPQFQGKGIMAEAVQAILDFGFDAVGLRSIEAFTSRFNERSVRLLLKKGFVLVEGKTDEDNPDNNIYVLRKS